MRRAFTLAELIIVIAVIGVLTAILIPVIMRIPEKAVAASALSDAKNTLDSLFSDYSEARDTNLVIAVKKRNKMFCYGWFHSINLFKENEGKPYELMDDEDICEALVNSGCLTVDSAPIDITGKIANPLSTVKVFSECSLCEIDVAVMLQNKSVTIGVGEYYKLYHDIEPYYDIPIVPIVWESSDPGIVEVSDGIITGRKTGYAQVTARYGKSVSTIDVEVAEWIEFDGNFAELKAIAENEISPVLIRLTDEVYLHDYPDIFPIVIPQGKTFVIDFDGNALNYSYSSDEYRITHLFVNDGGTMRLGTGVSDVNSGGIKIESPADSRSVECAVFNISGADLTIHTNMVLHGCPVKSVGASCTVTGGKLAYDFLDRDETAAVYNGENAELYIHGGQIFGIENYGTIKRITGGQITSSYTKQSGDAIVNYGAIDRISGGEISGNTDNWSENGQHFSSAAIRSTGKTAVINHIAGGSFNNAGYIDEMYSDVTEDDVFDADIAAYALIFENGASLGKITGGKLYSYMEAICFDTSFSAKGQVCGGCFLHKPDDMLIKKGFICIKEKFYWIITKK